MNTFNTFMLGASLTSAHGVDILAAVVLVIGIVSGGMKGLTGELARAGGLVCAAILGYFSIYLWKYLALAWFPDGEKSALAHGLIMVAGVAATTLITAMLVNRLLTGILRLLVDQPADAIFGVLVGALRSALLLTILFFLASLIPFGQFGKALFQESTSGRLLKPAVDWVGQQASIQRHFEPGEAIPQLRKQKEFELPE